MKTVQVLDKKFYLSISHEQIQVAITKVAEQMNEDLKNEDVIFLGILNGAFLFAADLFKQINFDTQISFLKVASYSGTSTSGTVKRLIGLNEDIENKTVVVLEDIIDSGITMEYLLKQLKGYDPKEIKIATLLFKPEAFVKDYNIDYIGMEIPNDFIVGYGLDYDGYGRNLKDIYTLLVE
ncbi:MAG: hypoxanthine phosphoribosyltransferase [Bacteroidales bacterium]|nr:hypoxanthine phosphoribosyltransferase [Bacteroidales bacterium]